MRGLARHGVEGKHGAFLRSITVLFEKSAIAYFFFLGTT